MMSSDNQDRPNRMATNTYSCCFRFHSSLRNAQHTMRKNEINCYIVFGWIGHLVEVQRETDHYEYVNIIHQQLLASSVDFFDNQNTNFVF